MKGRSEMSKIQNLENDKMEDNAENEKMQDSAENDKVQVNTENMKVQMMKSKEAEGIEENGNCINLPPSAVTDGDNKVHVCHSCQHLYDKNCGVVLTPGTLVHTQDHIQGQNQRSSSLTPLKPWPARRYDNLCTCCEAGRECHCNSTGSHTSIWQRILPRNAPWWPLTKIILLTVAGLLPWVFLIIYFILTYTK